MDTFITITGHVRKHTPDNFFTGIPTYVTILRLMNDGNGFPEPVPGIVLSCQMRLTVLSDEDCLLFRVICQAGRAARTQGVVNAKAGVMVRFGIAATSRSRSMSRGTKREGGQIYDRRVRSGGYPLDVCLAP